MSRLGSWLFSSGWFLCQDTGLMAGVPRVPSLTRTLVDRLISGQVYLGGKVRVREGRTAEEMPCKGANRSRAPVQK